MSPAERGTAAPARRGVAETADGGAAGAARLLATGSRGQATSLAEHLARHGPLPACAGADPWELIGEVERAGLTGRGGAAFPTAAKLRAVRNAAAGRAPLVIANGTEGEPASGKDRALLASAPHLVLDGAVYAAGLIGAHEAVVIAHRDVAGAVTAAAAERRNAARGRRPGADHVRVRVMEAAPGFVAGEASAVVNWVERGDARPTGRSPRSGGTGPASRPGAPGRRAGRARRPVLVQNVETLAHLALIARHGAGWFRSAGTPAEPGSMLITVTGAVRRPGVYEIGIGAPVSELIDRAGGACAPLTAFLVGGYFGTWVDAAQAAARPFSAAGLAGLGASPGAGLIAALPGNLCGLAETARLARYLAAESAGQCGPCVFGLDAIAGQLGRAATGPSAELGTVRRWLGQVTGRGACRHPDGAARMIGSALDVFAAETAGHARGWCQATSTARLLPVPGRVRS
jgi:NADH:ubiquinone oxidoreductase subunit F (NADH-binding)